MREGNFKDKNFFANLYGSFIYITEQVIIYVYGASNNVTVKENPPGDIILRVGIVFRRFSIGVILI